MIRSKRSASKPTAVERALDDELARQRRRRWLAENSEAVAAYNESVARLGAFSRSCRKF